MLSAPLKSMADIEKKIDKKLWVIFPKNLSLFHILVILTPSRFAKEKLFRHPLAEIAREYFKEYREHPAVQMTEKIFKEDWYFPLNYSAFYYSPFPNPKMKEGIKLPPEYNQNKDLKELISNYINIVNKFYEDTEFDLFWKRYKENFSTVIEESSYLIQKENPSTRKINEFSPTDIPSLMEDFYGFQASRYYFVPCPFMQNSATHVEVYRKDGEKRFFFLQGGAFSRSLYLIYFGFHEFGHCFIEPITLKYLDEINQLTHLYTPLKESFQKMGYIDWHRTFNEHLITAGQLHLMRKALSEEWMLKMKDREKQRGFKLIDKFYEYLKDYDENRKKYPNLETFFPDLLSKLSELNPEL